MLRFKLNRRLRLTDHHYLPSILERPGTGSDSHFISPKSTKDNLGQLLIWILSKFVVCALPVAFNSSASVLFLSWCPGSTNGTCVWINGAGVKLIDPWLSTLEIVGTDLKL